MRKDRDIFTQYIKRLLQHIYVIIVLLALSCASFPLLLAPFITNSPVLPSFSGLSPSPFPAFFSWETPFSSHRSAFLNLVYFNVAFSREPLISTHFSLWKLQPYLIELGFFTWHFLLVHFFLTPLLYTSLYPDCILTHTLIAYFLTP